MTAGPSDRHDSAMAVSGTYGLAVGFAVEKPSRDLTVGTGGSGRRPYDPSHSCVSNIKQDWPAYIAASPRRTSGWLAKTHRVSFFRVYTYALRLTKS